MSVDPLAAATVSMSPYAGMNNDPVRVMDPLGLQGEVNPAYNSTTPILVPYRPLGYWHYQNNSGEQPMAGQMTEDAMQRASDAQRIWQMLQNLGSTGAQGVAASPNNSGESYPNMIQEIVITGSKSEGKKPGFFGRVANSIKRFLGWGDDKVQGHTIEEVKKQEQPGGEEFTDKNVGVAHSGHTATFFNRKWPINNAGNLITLAGGWGTNPSAVWSNWKSNFDFFTNTYNLTTDGTSQLNDVMKENGLLHPAWKIEDRGVRTLDPRGADTNEVNQMIKQYTDSVLQGRIEIP